MAEVGVEPTGTSPSGWRLCRFAYTAFTRELRAWASNPARRAYEARPGTGPPAVSRRGETRTPTPRNGHERLRLARLPVPPPGDPPAPPVGFETTISTLTGWRALRATP